MAEPDPNAAVADSQTLKSLMVRVADEFIDRLNRGEQPDVEDYTARHPEIAGLLRQMLPALQLLRAPATAVGAAAGVAGVAAPEAECLGDFRLVREVGRGGMGVVYEAEQLSLGRRVAVKVLPFAAALDARHLQRFKNEAHAAAQLHHTHIVPVYAVGCERGVHFYAMQFIDGHTLAGLIAERRRAVGRDTDGSQPGSSPAPAPDTTPRAAGGTERSASDPAHFRTVARLGVQAAEGLEYAHRLGVVHRDVKPANLLVDGCGNLWITDFGLAQLQCETKLTLTGDLLGTLRYMSPEQALGGRALVDHRTDVYSLGATLYELLTLEPVFPGQDRQDLLRQIALTDPIPPRRWNRAVPPELETVVLKALAKNPAERYASAQELADDLQRYLDNRPIQAKRPSVGQRVRKWAIRHRPWVRAAAVAALAALGTMAGSIGWVIRDREAQQARLAGDVQVALDRAELFQTEGKRAEVLAAWERAEGVARQTALDPALQARLAALKERLDAEGRDQAFIARFEEIRLLEQSQVNEEENRFAQETAFPRIREALQEYGIEVSVAAPAEAVARIQARPESVQAHLLAALQECLIQAPSVDVRTREWLAAVLDRADRDPWRTQARQVWAGGDWQAFEQLAREVDVARQPPSFLLWAAEQLPRKYRTTRLARMFHQ
jgi:serine/threonine protein kinase